MTVIDFNAARLALRAKDDVRSGRDYCGPCYDKTGFVAFLVPHKIWGGGVGHSCPECGEEFDA